MDEVSNKWMTYIDAEVRAVCEKKGWGHQIRRGWSDRDKPVSDSSLGAYEWKLIPGTCGKQPDRTLGSLDEGTYYVLGFDPRRGTFILQHDTRHCGMAGTHWDLQTFTEIQVLGIGNPVYRKLLQQVEETKHGGLLPPVTPQNGWLRDILIDMTSRFEPNCFCIT